MPAQPGAVGRNQHSALRVLDAVGQGLFAKAAIDHGVHCAELGAGKHRDHQLGDAAHVDRHPVAFVHAHAAQDVGELIGLAVEPQIAVADLIARLAFPDQRQLVLAPGLDVTVERVERDIGLAALEPLVEGRVRFVQHLVPGMVPLQVAGPLGPEGLRVFEGAGIDLFVVLDMSVGNDLGRRVVDLMLGCDDIGGTIHGDSPPGAERVQKWRNFSTQVECVSNGEKPGIGNPGETHLASF